MKTRKNLRKLTTIGVCMSSMVLSLSAATYPAPREFTNTGGVWSINEDFEGWDGASHNSLYTNFPGFFGEMDNKEADDVNPAHFRGIGDGSAGGSSAAGLWSYGASGDPERAFGMFETGGTSDPRLHLHFKNNTGNPIQRLLVSFTAELWRDGERLNSIQTKYGPLGGPFGDNFLKIVAPFNNGDNQAVDGNALGNYVDGSAMLILPAPLAPGQSGTARWQLSTEGNTSGTRDGIGVDNINIEVLPLGIENEWDGGNGDWTDSKWNTGGAWPTTGDNSAVFGGSSATVTVNTNVSVVDLIFKAPYVLNGSSTITLSGVVEVEPSQAATVSAPILTANRFYKTGAGDLTLGAGPHTFSKGVAINGGRLYLGAANVIPAANRVEILTGAELHLSNNNLAINGIGGGGVVNLGSGDLTLDTEGSRVRFLGDIAGTGKVIKTGEGIQTFRTTAKTYTGATEVRDGVLEITENGIPASSSITVNDADGQGELALITDEDTEEPFDFGQDIILDDGYLSADSPGGIDLESGVDLRGSEPRIYVSGKDNVFTISGEIKGSSNWRKQGAGTLYLRGINSFTGQMNINNGTVVIEDIASFPEEAVLFFGDEDTLGRRAILGDHVTVGELRGNALVVPADSAELGRTPVPSDYALLNIGSYAFRVKQVFKVDTNSDEIKPSYQGDIVGNVGSTFSKEGYGTTRLTRYLKNFAGAIEVNEGVLQVSSEGQFAVAGTPITVASGGQLRLSSGTTNAGVLTAPTAGETGYYTLGGRGITLSSMERVHTVAGAPALNSDHGVLGGLRMDVDTAAGQHYGRLDAPIHVAADSDIHVSGVQTQYAHGAALTGSANLTRTGGGELILSNASGFTGTMLLVNGTTTLPAGGATGGAVTLQTGSAPVLKLEGNASFGGSLAVNNGAVLSIIPGSNITATGNINFNAGWVMNLNGVGAGTTTTFTGTVPASIHPAGSFTGVPSGKSASYNVSDNVITVTITP